tara:strand:+ start:27 stop:686 length:660 start_codon:yes stop_codon:yes gene_type:complete
MNLEFKESRELMVENQLRPNKISNPTILNLFKYIKKEDFLREDLRTLSYNDSDIILDSNRGYLKNLQIAQLISYSDFSIEDKVLHIGGMTGYVSAILSKLCKELIIIENNDNFFSLLKDNLENLQINNVKIFNSDLKKGYIELSPYDKIFIDNPIKELPAILKKQLNDNYGQIIMVKRINNELSKAYRIVKNKFNFNEEYLFDVFTNFELFKHEEGFIF